MIQCLGTINVSTKHLVAVKIFYRISKSLTQVIRIYNLGMMQCNIIHAIFLENMDQIGDLTNRLTNVTLSTAMMIAWLKIYSTHFNMFGRNTNYIK